MTTDLESSGSSPVEFVRGTDTVYVLDCSRSMADYLGETKITKIEMSKAAIVSALSRTTEYGPIDRIGLYAVTTNIFSKPIVREVIRFKEIAPLITSNTIPIEKIVGLRCEGGTALLEAIEVVQKILSGRANGNNQNIIVITDSRSSTNIHSDKIISDAIKNHTKISFVVLGQTKSKDEFKRVCTRTGGKFSVITNSFELERAIIIPGTTPHEPLVGRRQEQPPLQVPSISIALGKQDAVVPKRPKAETLEEIQNAVNQLTSEYSQLAKSLVEGKTSQLQFTERYSIIQYELQELRQGIRELRSKLSREMTEQALARNVDPESSLQRATHDHLLALEKQISNMRQ